MPAHSAFREKIPAYALGALDVDEIKTLETHLQTCAACQADLAAYSTVRDNLAMVIPPHTPPAGLRRRLQSRLPASRKTHGWRPAWSPGQIALGVALVLLVALNLSSLLQMRTIQQQQDQLTRHIQTDQIALAMLAYPGVQTLPIQAGSIAGTLLLDKDRNVAVLIAWNLPRLPENQTYQAWFSDAQGDRISAAVFQPDPSLPFTSVSIISPNELTNFNSLGVTVEPAGGSPHPTGPRIFKVDF